MNKLKPLICLMPWVNVSIKSNGIIRLCCLNTISDFSNCNISNTTIKDSRNCVKIKEYRKMFLNGVTPKGCHTCRDNEKLKITSKRNALAKKYLEYTPDIIKNTNEDGTIDLDKFPVLFYDLRLGNLCNARCVICGSINVKETFDWPSDKKTIEDIKHNIKNIKEIYFTGGEPFIIKFHWELIDYLIDNNLASNIYLRYHTNGSTMKKEFIDKWKHFKRVEVNFSIDGIGKTFEKIRVPLKWDSVEANIILFNKHSSKNIKGILSPTISSLNILELPKLINWFLDKNFKYFQKTIAVNFLYYPLKYSIKNQNYKEIYRLYEPYLKDHPMSKYFNVILKFIGMNNE